MANPRAQIDIVANAVDFNEDMKKVTQTTERTAKSMQTFSKSVENVNSRFGEGSPLKQTLDALTGAGAVAGVALLSRGIADAAEKAADLADQFRRGAISANELQAEIARSLPVLGDVSRAIEGIYRLITPFEESNLELIGAQEEILNKLKDQVELVSAASNADRERIRINKEYEATMRAITDAQQEAGKLAQADAAAAAIRARWSREEAEALRDARLEAVRRAEAERERTEAEKARAPIDRAIAALEAEAEALEHGTDALADRLLMEKGATDADIERVKTIREKIAALEAERDAEEKRQRDSDKFADRALSRLRRQAAEAAKIPPAVGGFESITGAFERIATAASTSGRDTAAQKTAREAEAMRNLLREMKEQGALSVEQLQRINEQLEQEDQLARFG